MSAPAGIRPSAFDPTTGRAIPDWDTRKPAFGVVARFAEIFRLVFRLRPLTFLVLVPLVVFVLPFAIVALGVVVLEVVDGSGFGLDVLPLLAVVLWLPISFFGAGLSALVGHDAMNGTRRPFGEALSGVFRNLGKLVVLGFAALALIALGNFVFPVLGLWAGAVVCCVMPAILVDGAGWRALGRSWRLTREYRWPIVGLTLLLTLLGFLAVFLATGVIGLLMGEGVFVSFGGIVILVALVTTAVPSLALVPVVHARLVAIKESGAAKDLGAVFD